MNRVLIIEDDIFLISLLTKQLNRLGYGVAGSVDSGVEAIAAVKKLKPDFLLVDISINGNLDGIETMREIKTFSDVPFIYLTGNNDPETKKRALETKPVEYLIKPLDLKELEKAFSMAVA